MPFTTADLARHLQGEVVGDADLVLTGFAAANAAKPGDLTFAENEEYFACAEESAAAAILVDSRFASSRKTLIRVTNARTAFARVLPLFFPPPQYAPGIHASAVVAASAEVDPSAHIGPLCVVGERTRIGARSVLVSGVHVGPDCVLGDDMMLYPHVTVYHRCQLGHRVSIHAGTVVGSDGFGYVQEQGRHVKVQQVGNVVIHDDVELGANVTVDRGALGSTVIGRGTKIDNLVQVAHNVVIGEHCILISQVGVAGSCTLGNYVVLGGQVGLAGHLHLGNQVTVGAQAGVMNNIPDGEKWLGSPAQPDRQAKRQMIAVMHLPDVIKRVKELENQLTLLKQTAPIA